MLRIKELAEARGFENVNQLALVASLPYPQVRRYWNNMIREYHADALEKFALALKVPVWALFEGAPDHSNEPH